MLHRRRWREMKPSDIVIEFNRLVPHAHIVKGRDTVFLRKAMENNALDSVDILWAIVRYSSDDSPRDIPNFCRWLNRNPYLFDEDRLAREGELAAALRSERLPVSTLPYYDLLGDSFLDTRTAHSFRSAASVLRSYVATILGPA